MAEETLTIGVDATCWQNNRGYGRHARALLTALVKVDQDYRYTFFVDSECDGLPSQVEAVRVRSREATVRAASADGHRSILDMARMGLALSRLKCDLLLFPTIYSFVPVISRARRLVFIHDTIVESYPDLTLPGVIPRMMWRTKSAMGRLQADMIATVSEYSRINLISRFRLPEERVAVVGEAPDPVFRRLTDARPSRQLQDFGFDTGDRSVVFVGGFAPHKNLDGLIRVFAALTSNPRFSDLRLYMVGENKRQTFHSGLESIRRQIDELDLADRVVFTGYLADEELVALLNLSTVLVLPSFMEGFGLPALEAAACGCPVVATRESPLPEVLGEGALFVNPLEEAELQSALERVLESSELRKELSKNGLEAAARYTWEAAARQLSKLIRELCQR